MRGHVRERRRGGRHGVLRSGSLDHDVAMEGASQEAEGRDRRVVTQGRDKAQDHKKFNDFVRK